MLRGHSGLQRNECLILLGRLASDPGSSTYCFTPETMHNCTETMRPSLPPLLLWASCKELSQPHSNMASPCQLMALSRASLSKPSLSHYSPAAIPACRPCSPFFCVTRKAVGAVAGRGRATPTCCLPKHTRKAAAVSGKETKNLQGVSTGLPAAFGGFCATWSGGRLVNDLQQQMSWFDAPASSAPKVCACCVLAALMLACPSCLLAPLSPLFSGRSQAALQARC